MQRDNQVPALSINQRNLYLYFLSHKKRHKHAPCYVPRNSVRGNGLNDYLKTLEKLEQLNLITVDRTADNYTGWIIKDPKN